MPLVIRSLPISNQVATVCWTTLWGER